MQTMFYWKTLQIMNLKKSVSLNPQIVKLVADKDDFDSIRKTSKFKKLIHSE